MKNLSILILMLMSGVAHAQNMDKLSSCSEYSNNRVIRDMEQIASSLTRPYLHENKGSLFVSKTIDNPISIPLLNNLQLTHAMKLKNFTLEYHPEESTGSKDQVKAIYQFEANSGLYGNSPIHQMEFIFPRENYVHRLIEVNTYVHGRLDVQTISESKSIEKSLPNTKSANFWHKKQFTVISCQF